MNELPGLCFDATGTLIEPREPIGEVYHRIAREFGVELPAWRLEDAFGRVRKRSGTPRGKGETAIARQESEVVAWYDFIRQVFQATDSTARFDDFPGFAAALFAHFGSGSAWRLRGSSDELVVTLTRLRDAGYPIAVVSNFDHRLIQILQDTGLEQFFDHVVLPFQVGVAKPDRGIFDEAARRLERRRSELVYIGDDSAERLEAIAGLGIQTISVRDEPDRPFGWIHLREQLGPAATV
jgi:putative hydrolase of the HAD superfamily